MKAVPRSVKSPSWTRQSTLNTSNLGIRFCVELDHLER